MSDILAIDDSPISLQMARNILKKEHRVIAVTEGQKALDYLKKNTCDLILLDYEMPGMDGMSVFLQLRDDPQTADIPIVFLTGNSDASTVSQILVLRPDGYIVKPFVPDELIKRVDEILEKRGKLK